MDIMINSDSRTATGIYLDMTCDNTSMYVSATPHSVTTLVQNNAHHAWRGGGKTFHGPTAFDQAMAAYKSGACKAMIEHARAVAKGAVAA